MVSAFCVSVGESSVREEDYPLVLALQACAHIQFVLKVYQEGNDPASPIEGKGKMNQSNNFFAAMKKKLNKSKSRDQVWLPSINTDDVFLNIKLV